LQEDNHLDEALALLNTMVAADPTDVVAEMRISEIERLQGHYNDALASLEKAKAQTSPDMQEEVSYNEALIYDALGKYDQAVGVLTASWIRRRIRRASIRRMRSEPRDFPESPGDVYSEQNKVADAVATYKQMADLGGDYAHDGYMGEVDAYREAHQWKDAFAPRSRGEGGAERPRRADGLRGTTGRYGQVDQALPAKAQLTGDATIATRCKASLDLHSPEALQGSGPAAGQGRVAVHQAAEKLDVYYIRGELYDRQKMYDQAEAEYRKALAIDPQNAGC